MFGIDSQRDHDCLLVSDYLASTIASCIQTFSALPTTGSKFTFCHYILGFAQTVPLTFALGNLPTEKVTKRDLFHIFHKHGRLAQISIKQAYGFVQFLEAAACYGALTVEQGVAVRGRKIRELDTRPTEVDC